MQILYFVFILIQIFIGIHLVFPLFLFLIYKLKSSWSKTVEFEAKNEADYAFIITAYLQTDQIENAVRSILALNYTRYHIYVVADNCDISEIKITHEKLLILRPENVLAANTKSHFYAINHFIRAHERLVIIDSDNLVEKEFAHEISKPFDAGFSAVQGLREAKNYNTDLAKLDAARDIYYHYYDGKLLFESGSSATLAGSGMAFEVALYKDCLEKLQIEGAGFDKVLQAEIVKRGKRIAFTDKAIVYDEKTSGSDQLVAQRARWINTWFRYFTFGFSILGKGLLSFNWNQILFGTVLLRPPLFILLILSVFFGLINLLLFPIFSVYWCLAFCLFIIGFLLSMQNSVVPPGVYESLLKSPKFIYFQLLALLKVRKANKISVATRHGEPLEKKGN